MRKQRRILGISGSPRRGNTELLLRAALDAAEAAGDICTETILLRQKTINHCAGCFRCYEPGAAGCVTFTDSMGEITSRLIECDGLILATPVYFGAVTGLMKTFMDRTEPLLRYAPPPLHCAMRNKIGAGIAVGGNRNGGQEATLQAIVHFFMIHDMIPVGAGPDEQPGCYLGAAAFSGVDPDLDERIKTAVERDEIGLRAAGIVGRRVAEALQLHSN
jgi:multimeric flavodoxin WrbA